ncbi:MAG: sulfatase [Armatimonadota bacterium]
MVLCAQNPSLRLRYLLGAVLLTLAAGCGQPRPPTAAAPPEPVLESGAPLTLVPGGVFRFAGHFRGGKAPERLPLSSDGERRIVLGDVRRPVLCARAPYIIRQTLSLPPGAILRLAFGLSPGSWNKSGGAVRFTVKATAKGNTATLLSSAVQRWEGPETANWRAVQLALPAGTVEIELATEALGARHAERLAGTTAAYALWVDPVVVVPAPFRQPNIVLVVVDALRADHLGCYGYGRATSPMLDSLARRGVLFDEASSQATWTLPSVTSLLTSTYRFVRRPWRPQDRTQKQLQNSSFPAFQPEGSLQSRLRDVGYETAACVGGGFLDSALGFDGGFDWYWSPKHTPMLANQLFVVEDRLRSAPTSPFFLLLHTFEVHNYFQGWAHDIGLFDRGYLGPLTDPRLLMDTDLNKSPSELSAADLQYLVDLYDGEIHHTDRYLGLFFEWLLAQPWPRDTVIAITADHGEGLGDHGAITHGGSPYRSAVHVPLILFSRDGRWGARRVREPVALTDLMPTLLELAGAPVPADLAGRSLLPLMEGERQQVRPVFAESRGAALMARDERSWYLTYRGERPEELYDVLADPEQTHNIAASSPVELSRMRRAMAGFAMQAARGYRIVVAGPRNAAVTIALESAAGFASFDLPTQRSAREVRSEVAYPTTSARQPKAKVAARRRVTVDVPAGGDVAVILFEPADPDSEVVVSVSSEGKPVARQRIHLGKAGRSPASSTITIGAAGAALLKADQPPVPGSPGTWGVWLWLPPRAAEALQPRASAIGELPEALAEQLKALGYLR